MKKIVLLFAALIVMSPSMTEATSPSGCQMTGAVCSCWSATGGWTAVCYYPNCGPCAIQTPPSSCTPDGSCSGPAPSCGTTGPGTDNCGNACTITSPGCCTSGTICGTITASEDGSALNDIFMLLRDSSGHTIAQATTDSSGKYELTVPGSGDYYVAPAINRREQASPLFARLSQSMVGNFIMSGVPAHVAFSGLIPGTFILLSTSTYYNDNPPMVGAGVSGNYITIAADGNGDAKTDVAGGQFYYVTCWTPLANGYKESISIAAASGMLEPETTIQMTCPPGGE